MKVGLWMSDFHVLQTEVHLMMAFVGSRMRISGRISGGRESQTDSSSLCKKSSVKDLESSGKLSDIASSFKLQRKRENGFWVLKN